MPRAGCCVIVTSLLALATAPASDAAGAHSTCELGRARVLAADRVAVVFRTGLTSAAVEGIWGCVRRHARYRLGGPESCSKEGCTGIDRLALGASIIAYQFSESGRSFGAPSHEFVVVRDLRDDRLLRRIATGGVQSIVVRGDGAVAWTAIDAQLSPGEQLVTPPCESDANGSICRAPYFAPPYVYAYDVYCADRAGLHLLAAGTDVDPRSLTLSGKTVRWRQAGRTSSALLR
jgi:hypothetical protein